MLAVGLPIFAYFAEGNVFLQAIVRGAGDPVTTQSNLDLLLALH